MLRRITILTAVVLVFSACELQAEVINSRWVGADRDRWNDPSSWDPPVVPDNNASQTFNVTISTIERTRIGIKQNRTINRLDCYGDIDLENSIAYSRFTLESNTGLTNHGKLALSGEGIEHNIMGNVTNTNGALIHLTDPVEVYGAFTNNGEVFGVPGSNLSVNNGNLTNNGKFFIYNGMVSNEGYDLRNTGTGTIEGTGVIRSDLSIENQGIISASGGSLLVHSDSYLKNTGSLCNRPNASLHISTSEDVYNNGTVDVHSSGGVSFAHNLVNDPNATVTLLGGTLAATTITQAAGASFEGFGGITGNLIIESDGIIRLTGPTNIVGDVTIEENAELEINDGLVIVTGHTACNGTIRIKGGRIVPQGGLSGDCNIISEPSDYNNMENFAFLAETWLWQID